MPRGREVRDADVNEVMDTGVARAANRAHGGSFVNIHELLRFRRAGVREPSNLHKDRIARKAIRIRFAVEHIARKGCAARAGSSPTPHGQWPRCYGRGSLPRIHFGVD